MSDRTSIFYKIFKYYIFIENQSNPELYIKDLKNYFDKFKK